jgi:hypothetical protein
MLSKWHLSPMPFPRVVYDDRNPVIFPYADLRRMARFEGSEIVVVGRVIGRQRAFYTHQGFMIMAEFIGYPDTDGNLDWIKVKDI